jgi:hypothetical protein
MAAIGSARAKRDEPLVGLLAAQLPEQAAPAGSGLDCRSPQDSFAGRSSRGVAGDHEDGGPVAAPRFKVRRPRQSPHIVAVYKRLMTPPAPTLRAGIGAPRGCGHHLNFDIWPIRHSAANSAANLA